MFVLGLMEELIAFSFFYTNNPIISKRNVSYSASPSSFTSSIMLFLTQEIEK